MEDEAMSCFSPVLVIDQLDAQHIFNYTTGATVVPEVKKTFRNQKVASSIPCRSVLEQDTEPLIAPDVQCAISVNVKMCIHPCKSHICKSLWIKASAKSLNVRVKVKDRKS